MAILKIAKMGHPVLARRAEPVADPAAPEIRRLVADMVETMIDANGAGLAAPQVHVPLRLMVFQAPDGRIVASHRQRALPLADLGNWAGAAGKGGHVVVVQIGHQTLGCLVDEVLGRGGYQVKHRVDDGARPRHLPRRSRRAHRRVAAGGASS